jgi:hypothetical protein
MLAKVSQKNNDRGVMMEGNKEKQTPAPEALESTPAPESVREALHSLKAVGVEVIEPSADQETMHREKTGRALWGYLRFPNGFRLKGNFYTGQPSIDSGTLSLTLETLDAANGRYRLISENDNQTIDNIEFSGKRQSPVVKQHPQTLPKHQPASEASIERLQTSDTHSTESILALTHINGIPIETLEARMRPGGISHAGFLGPNESLREVLAADNDLVLARGLTHQDFAEPLIYIRQFFGQARSGRPVRFVYEGSRYELQVKVYRGTKEDTAAHSPFDLNPLESDKPRKTMRGSQASPLDSKKSSNIDVLIKNLDNGKTKTYPDLLPEMINDVGFYEGRGTSYRFGPNEIVEMFPFLAERGRQRLASKGQSE